MTPPTDDSMTDAQIQSLADAVAVTYADADAMADRANLAAVSKNRRKAFLKLLALLQTTA